MTLVNLILYLEDIQSEDSDLDTNGFYYEDHFINNRSKSNFNKNENLNRKSVINWIDDKNQDEGLVTEIGEDVEKFRCLKRNKTPNPFLNEKSDPNKSILKSNNLKENSESDYYEDKDNDDKNWMLDFNTYHENKYSNYTNYTDETITHESFNKNIKMDQYFISKSKKKFLILLYFYFSNFFNIFIN